MSKILYFFYSVCFKPHANPTVINENIKELHILVVGVILEFPILSHMLLRRDAVKDLNKHLYIYPGKSRDVCDHPVLFLTNNHAILKCL